MLSILKKKKKKAKIEILTIRKIKSQFGEKIKGTVGDTSEAFTSASEIPKAQFILSHERLFEEIRLIDLLLHFQQKQNM